jgi:RNA polymerase sigma factor (sigma-70 family)
VTSYLLSLESLPHEPEQKRAESALDSVLRSERREAIEAALTELPAKNREVLQKYYFEDQSFEEIGQQMSLSRSWVCRIHAKSIEMMREVLMKQNGSRSRVVPATTQPSPCPYSS